MARYIDGDKLCRVIAGHSYYSGDRILSRIRCLQEGKTINESIKPDDVAPVVRARWKCIAIGRYECSCCGKQNGEKAKYCAECGAKMDEEKSQ